MAQYHSLSKELQERILEDREKHKKNPYAFPDEKIVRRRMDHDKANLWRPAFVRGENYACAVLQPLFG